MHAFGQRCTGGSLWNSSSKACLNLNGRNFILEYNESLLNILNIASWRIAWNVLQLIDLEVNKQTQQFQALVAAMISSQTRDAVTGAAMQRLRAIPGGLNVSQIASDAIEVDALAEILKPVGFYRCVLFLLISPFQLKECELMF